MGIAVIAVAAILFAAIGAGAYAIQEDLVPVKIGEYTNLEVMVPETAEASLTVITEEDICEEFPSLDGKLFMVPHINDIEYKVYETDASVEVIFEDYRDSLTEQGYVLHYTGNETVYGCNVQYNGYLKGPLTAVGIMITDDMENYNTIVGYVTGLSQDLKDMIGWFQESRGD